MGRWIWKRTLEILLMHEQENSTSIEQSSEYGDKVQGIRSAPTEPIPDLNTEPTGPCCDKADNQANQESGKGKKQKKSARLVKSVPPSMEMKDIVRANFQKKAKKGEGEKARSSSNGSINSISIEVMKTIEVGQDVGFQLDGFDQILRKEIEGEGVNKCQR
ncbi:hypothetical protein L2E82_30639 [Cichorium intybus]|uniref:Uncharacterized protein n=1 Tax=Cichorium intybus TaxID=13427 RepID=A0ACB9D144_CICIN|nr:hypothetical protein L2E82_30639 [Cichorium intybus]